MYMFIWYLHTTEGTRYVLERTMARIDHHMKTAKGKKRKTKTKTKL